MNQNELYHYGILGMKWGVRRTPAQLGYSKSDSSVTKRVKKGKELAAKKKAKEQAKAEKKANAIEKTNRKDALKNRRNLSDADLEKRIKRLKMEKEFKSLTESDISPGRKYVSEVMSSAGKKALTGAAAGAMVYGVKAAITKEFNAKEAAAFIAANPNKKK